MNRMKNDKSAFRYKKVGKNKYEYDFMSWDEWENMMDVEKVKRNTMTKEERTEMIMDIVSAYKEARGYDNLHLYTDHIGWLKHGFDEGWFEFPDDYDFDTSRWAIGMLLAQTERYGAIVMDTKVGTIPYLPHHQKNEFRNYLNEYNLMNEFDPDKVTQAFSLFCLSKLNDDQLFGMLNEFKEMFQKEVLKINKSRIQKTSPPNDEITAQKKEMETEQEAEVVTQRSLDDLKKTLLNLKLDKGSWRKIFDEVVK